MTPPADMAGWLAGGDAILRAGVDMLMAWNAALPAGIGVIGVFAALSVWATTGLPGASVLILAIGAVYGVWWGTLIVSLASALGAAFAFTLARHGLRRRLRCRHAQPLADLDRLLVQRGPWVLLPLRVAPVIPSPLLNPLMGLTTIRLLPFFGWSWLGMLGGTVLWVLVGAGLADAGVDVLRDVRVWVLLAAMLVLSAWARTVWR